MEKHFLYFIISFVLVSTIINSFGRCGYFFFCLFRFLKLGGAIGLLDELGNGVSNRVGGQHGVDAAGSWED